MTKTCMRDEINIRYARYFFKIKISFICSNVIFFVSFAQWWLWLSSDEHTTKLNNFNNRSLFFLSFFFVDQSKWTKLNQLAFQKHEKMVNINKFQAIATLIHVIKQLAIINKVNHIVGKILFKTNVNVKHLFRILYLLCLFFLHFTPIHVYLPD